MKVVFGGTFDPVHIGHLQMATELKDALAVEKVHLMPCHDAVHKTTSASSFDRLQMLMLSIDGDDSIAIDDREVKRNKPSYTIDSLKELREELGRESLTLVMGSDSIVGIKSWREVNLFHGLTNLVIIDRPNANFDQTAALLLAQLGYNQAKCIQDLEQSVSGLWFRLKLSALDISSSGIRTSLCDKKSVRYLVKDAVSQYICDNALYGS